MKCICEICFVSFITYLSMEAIFRHSYSVEVIFFFPRKQGGLMSFPIDFEMQRATEGQSQSPEVRNLKPYSFLKNFFQKMSCF